MRVSFRLSANEENPLEYTVEPDSLVDFLKNTTETAVIA
jgi:hypothetical protein